MFRDPSSPEGLYPNDRTVGAACPPGKKDGEPPPRLLFQDLPVSASLAYLGQNAAASAYSASRIHPAVPADQGRRGRRPARGGCTRSSTTASGSLPARMATGCGSSRPRLRRTAGFDGARPGRKHHDWRLCPREALSFASASFRSTALRCSTVMASASAASRARLLAFCSVALTVASRSGVVLSGGKERPLVFACLLDIGASTFELGLELELVIAQMCVLALQRFGRVTFGRCHRRVSEETDDHNGLCASTVGLFDQSHWYSRPTPKGWFA